MGGGGGGIPKTKECGVEEVKSLLLALCRNWDVERGDSKEREILFCSFDNAKRGKIGKIINCSPAFHSGGPRVTIKTEDIVLIT